MACAGILFASFVARVAGDNLAGTESREVWFWLSLAAQTVIYVWATTESSLYYLKLRRRQRLGLAEPLLAQRFLLWGIGMGAVALIWVYQVLTTLLMSPEWERSAANFAPISLLGFVCTVVDLVLVLPTFPLRAAVFAPDPGGVGSVMRSSGAFSAGALRQGSRFAAPRSRRRS